MDQSTMWWLGVAVLLILEVLTGTFYLLMLVLGLMAAAVCAHAGAGFTVQLVVASVVGAGAAAVWHFARARKVHASEQDLNLDIGQALRIERWDADNQARIPYRGAQWVAVLKPGCSASASQHYRVAAIDGSRLVVEPV